MKWIVKRPNNKTETIEATNVLITDGGTLGFVNERQVLIKAYSGKSGGLWDEVSLAAESEVVDVETEDYTVETVE